MLTRRSLVSLSKQSWTVSPSSSMIWLDLDNTYTEGCVQPKVVFLWRSSSTKGRLPPKVVFHQKLSSTVGHCPPNVIFHRKLSSTEGCLPPKVIFHYRSSSAKDILPPKIVFHRRSSSINHNTLVDHIFVRIVNIPNLSLLPYLKVA